MHRDQHFRRIRHLAQAAAGHLEDRQLRSAAEAVLDAAKDAVGAFVVAFELQDHVHDVLQDLGTGDVAVFCDVADKDHRHTAVFCETQQHSGHFLDLAHGARRALERVGVHSLHGVHDHKVRLQGAGLLDHGFDLRLAEDETVVRNAFRGKAQRPHFHLFFAFLASHVESPQRRAAEGNLQAEGGLAYAGLAAYQYERAAHDSAAQQPVELGYSEGLACLGREIHVAESAGLAAVGAGSGTAAGLLFRFRGSFHHRVPLAAGGAAPHPFRALVAAAGAVPDALTFACHLTCHLA